MKITKKLFYLSLTMLPLPVFGEALSLTGGWDSMLGDQWGLALTSDSLMGFFTIGGFINSGITSDAEDFANSSFQGRYGSDAGSLEAESVNWSAGAAIVFNGDEDNALYLGGGASGVEVDVDGSIEAFGNTAEGSGTFSELSGDVFIGWFLVTKPYFIDMRFGYRFNLESTVDIESRAGSATVSISEELEDPLLEGVFGSVTVGFSW